MIKERKEKSILLVSFIAGLLFAIAEYLFSIFSHSQSVLMDAVYDATELIFIALILFLTPLFYKPVSEKYPFGFFQIESIFLIVKSFMMLAVSLSVSVEIIESALSGGNPVNEWDISLFQLLLGAISVIVYFIIRRMNHALSSPTVNLELLGWKLDIGYSGGMAFAFFGATFLKKTPLAFIAPYFDQLVAVAVMIFMLPESIQVLWRSLKDIFLFSPEEETVNQIKEICIRVMEENAFHPVYFDITKTGRHLWVAVYFTIPQDTLDVKLLNSTLDQVNREVGTAFENCTCELIPAPERLLEQLPG